MITLNNIKEARKNLENIAINTPIAKAPILSRELNAEIYLKKENLQLTGSFKLRGAFNRVANLKDNQKKNGVVAASAGNHAQGLAFAAQYFGCEATIFMPEATPLTKVSGVRSYGAEVVLIGENFDEAYEAATKFALENSKEFIHPFADDDVIAGQGTIALEILEELDNLDRIIVPIGGGGLISGIAIAAKTINPNIKITGVVSSGAKGMKESFESRIPIDSVTVKTIADGIAVRDVTPKLLDIILEYVDEIVVYSTEKELIDIFLSYPIDVRILGIEYKDRDFTGKTECLNRGIDFYFNDRKHSFSTTELRKRVFDAEYGRQLKIQTPKPIDKNQGILYTTPVNKVKDFDNEFEEHAWQKPKQ
jgi:threonine dehydratase